METFLTVILFIFVGFWLLGLIGRRFLQWWIAKKQREFQQQFGGDGTSAGGAFGNGSFRGFYANFGGAPGHGASHAKKKKDGEVTVTQATVQSEYQVNKGIGEYVEYEEVATQATSATSNGQK